MIVASGFEAGGHRPSFLAPAEQSTTGTFVLIQLLKEKVKVPVIAAGGIANGRGIAGALTLGADAVQVGTAFLACDESGASPAHKSALLSEASRYTMLTKAYTGRLGRGLTTRIGKELIGREDQFLPYPLQGDVMAPLLKAAQEQQKHDMLLFWGGQIAPILHHTRAEDLMHSLITDTSAYLD
jgi:nitronate monooxygenase